MMSIDEMREHEWYVGWSGGKDSTATIIKMHEHKIPIKEIVYVRMMYDDTLPATLPIMTDFIDEAKKVFESWGYPVTILKSNKTAMDVVNTIYKRSKKYPERNGCKYGVTTLIRGGCSFSGWKSKTLNSVIPRNAYQMIGYAADETKRLHRLGSFKESILVTLGITEKECFDICRQYNLLSPWYDLGFNRDGCWFCPSADKKERAYLRENHPDLIEKINRMIEMCEYDLSSIIKSGRNIWVKEYKEGTMDKNKINYKDYETFLQELRKDEASALRKEHEELIIQYHHLQGEHTILQHRYDKLIDRLESIRDSMKGGSK